MICPRCSVAEISEDTHQCVLCGYAPSGAAVAVDRAAVEEMQDIVQKPLAGRFEIEQLIGRGKVSFVYSAREVATGNRVALKIIPLAGPLDADLVRRFEREAGRAASLRHSHIVPIHGSGASGALLWYTMDQVKGHSLAQRLRDHGPMDLEACLRMLEQVASALDYAHRRSIIHGNLKSTDVLLDDDGWARVTDFAIMQAFGRSATGFGMPSARTPEYMAPEQFYSRGTSASADQYALGVIAHECLSGALPFVGDSYEEIARLHQEATPTRLTEVREDVPLLIADAVEQALRKRPTDRFANVLDFVTVLRGGPPQGAEPMAPMEEPRGAPHQVLTIQAPSRQLPRSYVIGGGVAALALAAVLLVARAGGGRDVATEGDFRRSAPPAAPTVTSEPSPAAATPTPQQTREERQPAAQQPATPPPRETASLAAQPAPEPVEARPQPVRQAPPPVRRPVRAEAAKLFVNATPWGSLYIDDELVGNTPKANLSLTPGTHVIRVQRDGFEPHEVEVEVAPGEEVRMTDIVLKPRRP